MRIVLLAMIFPLSLPSVLAADGSAASLTLQPESTQQAAAAGAMQPSHRQQPVRDYLSTDPKTSFFSSSCAYPGERHVADQHEHQVSSDPAVKPNQHKRFCSCHSGQSSLADAPVSVDHATGLLSEEEEEDEELVAGSYHTMPLILANSARHGLDPLRVPLYILPRRNFHWPIFRRAFECVAELRTESTEGREGEMDMEMRRLAEPEWYRAVRNIWYRAIRTTTEPREAESSSLAMDKLERFVQLFFPASRLRTVLLWDMHRSPSSSPKGAVEGGEQVEIVHERPMFSFVAAGMPLFSVRGSSGRELSFTSERDSVVVHRFNPTGMRPRNSPIVICIEFDDRQLDIHRSLHSQLNSERHSALSAFEDYSELPFESFPWSLRRWSQWMLGMYDDAVRKYEVSRLPVHSPKSVFLRALPYADIDFAIANSQLPLIVRVSSKRGDVVPPEVPIMHLQTDTISASLPKLPQTLHQKVATLRSPALILAFAYADEMMSRNGHLMTYDAGWHYSLDTSSHPFRCSSKDPFAVILAFNYDEKKINGVAERATAVPREADIVVQQTLESKWASLAPKTPSEDMDKQEEQSMLTIQDEQIIDHDTLLTMHADDTTEEQSDAEYVQEQQEEEERRFEHKNSSPDPLHLHAEGSESYGGERVFEDAVEGLPLFIPESLSSPSTDMSFAAMPSEPHQAASGSPDRDAMKDDGGGSDTDFDDIEDRGGRVTTEFNESASSASSDNGDTIMAMFPQLQQGWVQQGKHQLPQPVHQSQQQEASRMQSQRSPSPDILVDDSGRSDAEF